MRWLFYWLRLPPQRGGQQSAALARGVQRGVRPNAPLLDANTLAEITTTLKAAKLTLDQTFKQRHLEPQNVHQKIKQIPFPPSPNPPPNKHVNTKKRP
ncbi:MAG: hypothetical protein ACK5M5_05600, partial [Limnobaculum xujianqingii]